MLVFLIHYLGLRGLLYVYLRELRRKLKLVMIETLFRLHMLKVESFMFRLSVLSILYPSTRAVVSCNR
jgi:hypothetical protein